MERELVRRLARAVSAETEVEDCSGQQAIDDDDALVEKVAALPPGSSCLRIWENQNCLVTTRPIARREGFTEAANLSARSGWPVYVRSSGGSTVIHRPGILNVSLAVAAGSKPVKPNTSYESLITLLQESFQKLHINPFVGPIQGAYCDGSYNLCLKGRKIAGTASRIVRRKNQNAYICHASIAIYGSPESDISLISKFERELGLGHVYARSSHITLANIMDLSLA
ncbi:lipoate--protein ligase family protein [Parasphingorhabdus sp.]|uniref:lipoate--protein ligase family protein n=1 Tax=Parasphingorhabdus sp. TaxID=2709688 RepID=UPI003A8D16B6